MKKAKDQEDVRHLMEKLQLALVKKSGSKRRFLAITVNQNGLFSIQGANGIRLQQKISEDQFVGETIEGAFNKLLEHLQDGNKAILKLDENRDQFDASFGYQDGEWIIHSALQQSYEYRGSLSD